MKIVYPICCGMDIHKNIIVATIATTDQNGITTYDQKTFSTMNYDVINLRDWLLSNNCRHACMESTGKYWIPIWNILESEISLTLAHPKYTKAIKGKKTDKKDSKWIADLFKHDLVPNSFIPPANIRQLRDLSRYRYKLTYIKVSEKNRIQNCFTMSNIRIDSVVSDPFGKSARLIMNDVLNNPEFKPEDVIPNLKKRLKKKESQIIEALQDINVSFDQHLKMDIAYNHLDKIDEYIKKIELNLDNLVQPYNSLIDLLCTIPGLQRRSSIAIIAETGVDMSQFIDAKHFASWAGLAPTNNESANKKKSVRISHAGVYLKPLLVQVALNSIRDSSNNYFTLKYNILKKRRGHKKAIIAIARMILVSIYHILLTGEPFHPYDFDELKNPIFKEQAPSHSLNEENAINYLKSLGYSVNKFELTSCNE